MRFLYRLTLSSKSLLHIDHPAPLMDTPESAQMPVTAMGRGERIGDERPQNLPPLTARPYKPAAAVASDWLSSDHQRRFLLSLVDVLDRSPFVIPTQAKDPRMRQGFSPRMMTLMLLYAYRVVTRSSRKIERAVFADPAVLPASLDSETVPRCAGWRQGAGQCLQTKRIHPHNATALQESTDDH